MLSPLLYTTKTCWSLNPTMSVAVNISEEAPRKCRERTKPKEKEQEEKEKKLFE